MQDVRRVGLNITVPGEDLVHVSAGSRNDLVRSGQRAVV